MSNIAVSPRGHPLSPSPPPSTLHPSMFQCFRRHIPRSTRNVGSVWFKNSPISSSAWHAAPARLIVVRAAGMWRWLQIWESYWSRTCPPLEYRGQETGFSRANALFPTTLLWVLCQILHAWTGVPRTREKLLARKRDGGSSATILQLSLGDSLQKQINITRVFTSYNGTWFLYFKRRYTSSRCNGSINTASLNATQNFCPVFNVVSKQSLFPPFLGVRHPLINTGYLVVW